MRPVVIILLLFLLAGHAMAASRQELLERIDRSLADAGAYLTGRQQPDGSWRSGVHGSFQNGIGLTPHVLTAQYFLAGEHPPAGESVRHGIAFLLSLTDADGQLHSDHRWLTFPVYSSAEIAWMLHMTDRVRHERVQQAWLARLRSYQLGPENGWRAEDPEFGGWGYSPAIPKRPPDGSMRPPMLDSNLSATLFAVGALRIARVPADDPVWQQALTFIDRCQNYPDDPAQRDTSFDDGGMFFMPADAARNKPGPAGDDRHGQPRYWSYGSMTADGVRAMLACGRPIEHPRVVAAREWLIEHFDATQNPGRFNPDREFLREGTYYYWCWSAAHAMQRLGASQVQTPADPRHWAEWLAETLIERQQADGSWKNGSSAVKEDDPLVATPFAASALWICRDVLSRQ